MDIHPVYPSESFFYPYHIVYILITGVLFFVILGMLYKYSVIQDRDRSGKIVKKSIKTGKKIDIANSISLSSLIVTLVVSGIYPFLQNPLLDYNVNQVGEGQIANTEKVKVTVSNYGIVSAKNTVFSMSSNNVKFTDFVPQPYLSDYFKTSSIDGSGLFEIAVLPPRSDTEITVTLDTSKINQNIQTQDFRTYVRSDERVGFVGVLMTIAFYISLGFFYIISYIIIVIRNHLDTISWKPLVLCVGVIVGLTGIFTIAYAYVYANPLFRLFI